MEHPIYGLDKVIVTYLDRMFSESLGKPFTDWKKAEDEAAHRHEDETRKLGWAAMLLPTEELDAQEKLVAGAVLYRPRNEAWKKLSDAAGPRWKSLLELYACVKTELRDLENMDLALQLAEREGSAEYAAKVKELLSLDEITEPMWWNMG